MVTVIATLYIDTWGPNIPTTVEKRVHTITLCGTSPILTQLRDYFRTYTTENVDKLHFQLDGRELTSTQTVGTTKFHIDPVVEVSRLHTKEEANPGLVQHIKDCKFNPNTCIYMGPNIAMWKLQ